MADLNKDPYQQVKVGEKKSKIDKYILFLFIYMILYEFMDSYSTSYMNSVVSYIMVDLSISETEWYLIQAIASIGLFAVLLIQSLADVIGRKPMMIFAFFGMGLSSLILLVAHSKWVFAFGYFLLWMFFSSDMWVIIVSEESPEKTRGRNTYLISVLGALGVIAIPICRSIFISTTVPAEDATVWRAMNYLPLLALPISLLGFKMKETEAFHQNKLKSTEKETFKHILEKYRAPFEQSTKIKTIIFMIFGFLLGFATAATSTLESFFTNTFDNAVIVTNITLWASLGTFFFFGISGPLADKWGRKPLIYLYLILTFIGFCLVVFIGPLLANKNLAIIFYCIVFVANGTFWASFMLSKTFCVESFPTTMRGTAAGWRSFLYAFGITAGSVIAAQLVKIIDMGWVYIISVGLIALIMIPLIAIYIPETKGIKIVEKLNV